MKSFSFGILSPSKVQITNSAGIFVLHRLGQFLNKLGHKATMLVRGESLSGYDFIVLPEIYHRSVAPIDSRIIRWVLCYPGMNKDEYGVSSPTKYGEDEIPFHWDPIYDEIMKSASPHKSHVLWLGTIDNNLFHKNETKTIESSFWIGKGKENFDKYFKILPQGCMCLPRHCSREEFAGLMKKSRVMYSFDDNSCATSEAILCGCEVMTIKNGNWTKFEITEERAFNFLYNEAEEIKRVQEMVNLTLKHFNLQ